MGIILYASNYKDPSAGTNHYKGMVRWKRDLKVARYKIDNKFYIYIYDIFLI